MSRPRDYYRILHVQPDAPAEIINASYRTLMQRLRHHPDLGGDHDTAVLLNEAHAVLSDPERRAAYDAGRAPARGGMDASVAAAEPDAAFGRARCAFCNAPHGIERALVPDDACARCASPLFPAERQRLEYAGQRMLSRIPKALAVGVYTRWPQAAAHAAELRDASLNGMQVSTLFRLEQNRIIRVDCEFCRAVGRVAHCRRDPENASHWLTGVEFVTLRFASARGNFVSTSA